MNVDCEANKEKKKSESTTSGTWIAKLNLKNKNITIYTQTLGRLSSEANLLAMCKQCLAFWSVKH